MPERYTTTARILHWLVALAVLCQIALGLLADRMARDPAREMLDRHVQLGLVIFALVILRLLWRASHAPPPLGPEIRVVQRMMAKVVHCSLYLLLLLMPISGYLLWMWIGAEVSLFGISVIPVPDLSQADEFYRSLAGYAHEYAGYALFVLLGLHIVAALWHEFIIRDGLISKRMM